MLPISRHRTLVIPHRLALVAAAICLALSFTADRSATTSQLKADVTEPTEQIEAASADSAAPGNTERRADSRSRAGKSLSLLPWFSGLSR